MNVRFALAALMLVASGCSSDKPTGPEEKPDLLPARIYALDGLSPTLPPDDLAPFRQMVGNTRVVALGESTHASVGFYQAKYRLIRYMVEEMGFRIVTFETPWLAALPATRFVETCEGGAHDAMRGFFQVWRDATVRNMLQWMCDYNKAHPNDKVKFYGMDIQEPWNSVPALEAFVSRSAPDQAGRVDPLRRCLGGSARNDSFFVSTEYRDLVEGRRNFAAHDDCIRGITEMEAWISANQSALQAATSMTDVEEARLSLVAIKAMEDQLWIPDPGGYQGRDRGMAELTRRLQQLHAPDKKMIVWAWNWHIARRYEEVRGFDEDPERVVPRQGARAMGGFLSDAYGSNYMPIALIGYHVGQAFGTQPPLQVNPLSIERRLNDLGQPYLLVDLRQPLPDTIAVPGRTYRISQEWGDPYRQYDGLVFLSLSNAATLLPP
jgi:erythromycin esterase-like protein